MYFKELLKNSDTQTPSIPTTRMYETSYVSTWPLLPNTDDAFHTYFYKYNNAVGCLCYTC
jgi:hypothetical protein